MVHENMPAVNTGDIQMEVIGLGKRFTVKSRGKSAVLNAVTDVSFTVKKGETFSIVGESGCGKSTLGRCLARLIEPTQGQVLFEGRDIGRLEHDALRQLRKRIQFIFQDPYSSMNPRMRVRTILAEPLRNFAIPTEQVTARLDELLKLVSLKPEALDKYPHQFSGGQRQRLVIARALALNPDFIVCDEPVSALDVSVQAQVINLLVDLQRTLQLTYLFISHDLSVVRHLSHSVAVMYLGRIVEVGTCSEIFNAPRHPYTKALLAAVPRFEKSKGEQEKPLRLSGEIPSPLSPPSGCAFRTRCPNAQTVCAQSLPEARLFGDSHVVACHFA